MGIISRPVSKLNSPPPQERILRWERLADGSIHLLSDPNEVWAWLKFMVSVHKDAWPIPLWEKRASIS